MALSSKVVLIGHGFANAVEFSTGKLNQYVTGIAVEVIVLWIAIVVFVNGSTGEVHFFQ